MKQTGVTWGRPSARVSPMWASLVPAVTKDRHSLSVMVTTSVCPFASIWRSRWNGGQVRSECLEAPAAGAEPVLLTECEHLRRLHGVDVPGIGAGGVGRIVELAIPDERMPPRILDRKQPRDLRQSGRAPNEMGGALENKVEVRTGHRDRAAVV